MGRAVSSYARLPRASSTKIWRGTLRMRSSTARLAMPCSLRRWTRRSRVRAEVMPMPVRRTSVINAFQPARQGGQGRVTCQIDLQGRHRDIPFRDRMKVRPGSGLLLGPGRTDPIDGPAMGILGAHDRLGGVAETQASGAKAPQLGIRLIGHVDVEDEGPLERPAQQLGDQSPRHFRRRLEMPLAFGGGAQ